MSKPEFALTCPAALGPHDTVQLAHGGGGRLTRQLIEELFLPAFHSTLARDRHDSVQLTTNAARLAFTTDSYVVTPRFFPGGDIGGLAVFGTVNDLAMAGASPRYLSVGFILEEGLPLAELRTIVASMQRAADSCGVEIVTGDTKVVDRGKADGLFINTSGVGTLPEQRNIRPGEIRPGDAILVSGDLGRHGIAILSVRHGLEFGGNIESDCASLLPQVHALLQAEIPVHCLRDLTRGGLATALNELAVDTGLSMELDECAISVTDQVAGACELLGLDPLYVACEGRMVALVPEAHAGYALELLRGCPGGTLSACIGRVGTGPAGEVTLVTPYGSRRLLDLQTGEQLPRIC